MIRREIKELFFSLLIFFLYLFVFHFYLLDKSVCLFKLFFHFPCPTCGLSRSYIEVLKFNFNNAFELNPLFFIYPIVLFIFIFRDRKVITKIFHSSIFWTLLFVLIFVTYLIKCIFFKELLPF